MAIKVGDKIPDVTLKRLGSDGIEAIGTAKIFKGKKVVLFSVPGAFTPVCTQKHLPGYVQCADEFKARGVDLVCMAVNDPWVMREWGKQGGTEGKIALLPDGNGEFAKALGLCFDGSEKGLGLRAQRFALYAEDGIVKSLNVEQAGEFNTSSAASMLEKV